MQRTMKPEVKTDTLNRLGSLVRNFENHDQSEYIREIEEQADSAFNAGESCIYEISQSHAASGHTETLHFYPEEFI